MKKILYLISEDWYFWSHRRSIAIAALNKGYEVTLVTRVHEKKEDICKVGIKLVPIRMKRSSVNPFYELRTILDIIRIYWQERPDIAHHVALKPVLYGTLAARVTGVDVIVNALGGLGHLFSAADKRMKILKKVFSFVLKLAFSGKDIRLILQNLDDKQNVIDNNIAPSSKIILIRGSGANLDFFQYKPEIIGVPVIMYAGRLLWSKGVGEFVQAAEILEDKKISFKAVIVGRPDSENPESISISQLREWEKSKVVEWWGYREDMNSVLAQSAIIVLPARFREGLPKVLLEAAAVGRPIVTSNLPGCREVVHHNWNGLLVPPRDPEALADTLEGLLLNQSLRQRMGHNGRKLVEEEFSEEKIVNQTLATYEELLS